MKRWLPSPFLSAGLLVMWLMLNQTISPGHILLGAIFAIAIPLLTAPLRPAGGPIRHPLVLARLILTVGADVVLSALQVGWGIWRLGSQPPRSSFVAIPLELRDQHALAALAMIASVIPGTVWSELAVDRSVVLMHVFDVDDEATFIQHFKERYERPLKEIFE